MLPNDSGPIYHETLMGRFPVEPWNTWSNIVFLLVVMYWAWRVYPRVKHHGFLAGALPVLFLGFVGGTVFHATRSHEVWLLMDWVPIVLLCTACMALFARRAGVGWAPLILVFALPFLLRYVMLSLLHWPPAVVMNAGYAALGAVVLVPILLHLRRNAWAHGSWMIASALCFGLAVIFRTLDQSPVMAFMPMGTHWLWHALGGVAVHFLIGYIWWDDVRRESMRTNVTPSPL